MTIRKIKEMIESAPTKIMALNMLEEWKMYSDITDEQYQKGRELIREEFDN